MVALSPSQTYNHAATDNKQYQQTRHTTCNINLSIEQSTRPIKITILPIAVHLKPCRMKYTCKNENTNLCKSYTHPDKNFQWD